jgi:hypothetical protein
VTGSIPDQHPLQMLLIFASTLGSSARISASPDIDGPGVTVPSMRPPFPAPTPLVVALPVVLDRFAAAGDPAEFAVPKVFVPGAVGIFAELPEPLGSLPELLSPVALAGPAGMPLTPAVPAPVEPAVGDPTALLVPAEGPLAAPAAEAPPAEVPPAEPPPPPLPPPPPPPPCAKVASGLSTARTINNLVGKHVFMVSLLLASNAQTWKLFRQVVHFKGGSMSQAC